MKLSKEQQKKIAKERIDYLFLQANNIFSKNSSLANRYVQIALKLRDRCKVTITKKQKAMFCKACKHFLVPGVNCIVRLKNKALVYHCKACGNIRKLAKAISVKKK
jgi:ribonuclease P protein subunit RPR2